MPTVSFNWVLVCDSLNSFCPSHVVRGGRGYEDDGRHVVEALNPLPPLVTLPAHVKHVELDLVHPKQRKGGED